MEFGIDLQSTTKSDEIWNWFAINYQFRWNLELICNQLSIPMEFVFHMYSIINSYGIFNLFAIIVDSDGVFNLFVINYQFPWNLWFICIQLLIPMEYVIYLQSIISSDGICNLFAIDYQFWWNLKFTCIQLLILIEFIIYLQSMINSYGIYNWFAINYQFRWNLWFICVQLLIPMDFGIDL